MTIILVIMEAVPPFAIVYAPITRAHVRSIEPRYYSLIRETIEQQVTHQPLVQTRNRKPLKRSAVFDDAEATWELRFGPRNKFRVFYSVNAEERTVFILAIGIKIGNHLSIGGEEITL
jgi:mRNA-degrading endonuclease RelE of RelBE toxin-antitoxin system